MGAIQSFGVKCHNLAAGERLVVLVAEIPALRLPQLIQCALPHLQGGVGVVITEVVTTADTTTGTS